MSDRARLPQLEGYARASADVAEAYRMQFQLGQRSLLDVLNAENESFNARASAVAGRALVAFGELRLLASIGVLLETLGVSVFERKTQTARDPVHEEPRIHVGRVAEPEPRRVAPVPAIPWRLRIATEIAAGSLRDGSTEAGNPAASRMP